MMRFRVAAIGRARRDAAASLYEDYAARIPGGLGLQEFEVKKKLSGPALKAAEADLLLGALQPGERMIALDESGRDMTSPQLARTLRAWRDNSVPACLFVIGGADGLDETLRNQADLVLSFGRLTWPHMMVRAMLAEQIYRCEMIMAGHPYHRE